MSYTFILIEFTLTFFSDLKALAHRYRTPYPSERQPLLEGTMRSSGTGALHHETDNRVYVE